AALVGRVGPGAYLVLKVALRRFRRHVDACAGHVELPAVIDAAQAVFLVPAKEHAGAAVRAGILDDADPAGGGPEGDEVLAEQTEAHGRSVRDGQLIRPHSRDPVLAHEVAHGRTGTDATQ